jgi:RNA polymerase sigma-70 factor (ECF subfamily)
MMSVYTEEDFALLEQAARFDESALAVIYDRYHGALFKYAYRLLGDEQLTEECVSDTFFRFLKNLRNGGLPNENLRAYLYRIAHNWISDYYRSGHKDREQALDDDFPGRQDLVEEVNTRLQTDNVRAALLTLTPDQQQVILLKYFEGWQNEEIAQFMGKRVGAVKALLHRSIATLRKKCQNQE